MKIDVEISVTKDEIKKAFESPEELERFCVKKAKEVEMLKNYELLKSLIIGTAKEETDES